MHTDTLNWNVVDDTASRLGAGDAARRKWKQRQTGVPHEWRIKIFEALKTQGVEISFADFDRLRSSEQST